MNARKLVLVAAMVAATGAGAQGDMPMHHGKGMMGDADAKVSKADYLKGAEERFARLDVNKDGVIDATDRAQLRQRMHECRQMMGDMRMMGGHPHRMEGPATSSTPPPKPTP
jgi:hypothetical protein